MIQTVITAASDSSELFIRSGFGCPKNLVCVDGREVLLRAIDSYSLDHSRTHLAILKAESEEYGTSELMSRMCPAINVTAIPFATQGALITALIALEGFDLDEPLLITGGDSEVSGGVRQCVEAWIETGASAATLAFESTDPRWSYVRVGRDGHVRQVAEKLVIGPYATTGVFYFRSVRLYIEAATWCLVNNAHVNGTFYVSNALNYLIQQGDQVLISKIDAETYRTWALPADYLSTKGSA